MKQIPNGDCPLCGAGSGRYEGYKIDDSPGDGINLLIICPQCREYAITDMAQRYYFYREDRQEVITEKAKKILIEYVKKNQKPSKPALITAEIIRQIIGKE